MKYSNEHIFLKSTFTFFLYWLIVYICFWNITYTDDLSTYEDFYYNNLASSFSDPLFFIIRNICVNLKFSFTEFYNLCITLIFICYWFLFDKYRINKVMGLIFVILALYVQIANQIRYFLAFPLFLLSLYYWGFEHKHIKSLIIAIFAILSHNGILPLYIFIPLYEICHELKIKKIILIFIAIGVFGLLISSILFKFMPYLKSSYSSYSMDLSSLRGSIFVSVFSVSWYALLFFINNKIVSIKKIPLVYFSYIISLYPIIFLIISFSGLQIINGRYVNAFYSMWTILLLQLTKIKEIRFSRIYVIIFAILIFVIKYLLSDWVFGRSYDSEISKVLLIWESKT